jgi:CRISPR-associated protein Csm4
MVSGTIWGHLAWAIRYLEGPDSFASWLLEQETGPWLLSSCMPTGKLPRPLLKPAPRGEGLATLAEMSLEKQARKVPFISEELFIELRDAMSDLALVQALKDELRRPQQAHGKMAGGGAAMRAHNRIDRWTGSTPETGGLYFDEVHFGASEAGHQFFIQTESPCLERLQALLDFVGDSGYGRNASTGCGHLHFLLKEEKSLFSGTGNRAISLSHGILSRNMAEPRYRQHVHYGKLGGDYAKGEFSPFKYPILMAKPGATFAPLDGGLFGDLLVGVHHDPALAHVRHHAFHLALPFTEVSP